VVTKGAFENGSGTLLGSAMHTGSLNWSGSLDYFYTIQSPTATSAANKYFDISYGNLWGSGSHASNEEYSTKAVYYQWRNLLLKGKDTNFTFSDVSGSDAGDDANDIYVFALKTDKLNDGIAPEFTIQMTGSDAAGDSKTIKLTTGDTIPFDGKTGNYYRVVSGSAGVVHVGTGADSVPTYGNFYPDIGVIVFSGDKLRTDAIGLAGSGSNTTGSDGFSADTSSNPQVNINKMVQCMKNGQIQMRTYTYLNQTSYYCRMYHNEYNHTTNSTIMVSGTLVGEIQEEFQTNPITYVTSLGLYNNSGDLIASAAVNKPVLKTKQIENTFCVKIDT
jgi:hypothetical protein